MGQIFEVGVGSLQNIRTKEDLKANHYISAKTVHKWVFDKLCQGLNDAEQNLKYNNYLKQLSANLNRVKLTTNGHTSYYYSEYEVYGFIQSVLKGDEQFLKDAQREEFLKRNGFVDGGTAGKLLMKKLKESNIENYSKSFSVEFNKMLLCVTHEYIGSEINRLCYLNREELINYLNNFKF